MNAQQFFILSSYTLLVLSIIGFFLGVFGVWPKGEPKVILAISWLALVFSAFGNIISAQVNKKVDNGS